MSDPAYYVFVDGPAVEILRGKYSAVGFELNFLRGLEQTLDLREWLDSEEDFGFPYLAVALVDVRDRLLALYSNQLGCSTTSDPWWYQELRYWHTEYMEMSYAYRAAVFAVLEKAWPGWRIRWAYNGTDDIVTHLGRRYRGWEYPNDPQRFTPMSEPDLSRQVTEAAAMIDHELADTLVTIAEPGKPPRACTIWASDLAFDIFRLGPALLPVLPTTTTITELAEPPLAGLHLDVGERKAAVWTTDQYPGLCASWARQWPDWQLELLGDKYEQQLAHGPAELFVLEPDVATALEHYDRRIEQPAIAAARSRLGDTPHWPAL